MLDITPAFSEQLNLSLVDIEAKNLKAGPAELEGKWQADISETDDTDPGIPGFDLLY
jgi:hypothetical protein